MQNSYETLTSLKQIGLAVLLDCHAASGTNPMDIDRDIDRYSSLLETRGLRWITIELPEAGKVFDQALASGSLPRLPASGFRSRSKGDVRPIFLGSWFDCVFDQDGIVLDSVDSLAVANLRQIFFCFKKLRFECSSEAISETINEFYECEKGLREPSCNWDDPLYPDGCVRTISVTDGCGSLPGGLNRLSNSALSADVADDEAFIRTIEAVQTVFDCYSTRLGAFCPHEWKPRHGPGAVSDGSVGKFYKYDFPTWSDRLEQVFPYADFAFANFNMWVDSVDVGKPAEDDDHPSRLICVPKTLKGPRLIAAEPTSNQFAQQIVRDFLESRIAETTLRHCVDFKSQDLNRDAALLASTTGELATIDLKSASDCVSLWLVERVFRRNIPLLSALKASRTTCVEERISNADGNIIRLKKFSTQGAATTFPVQTFIYVCIAIAVTCVTKGLPPSPRHFDKVAKESGVRAFGDDIVVPTAAANMLVDVLTYLGFQVNRAKTFLTGKFRESCGMDAFDGVDVAPSYVLEIYDGDRPSSFASVIDTSNNLHNAGLWRAADALINTLPRGMINRTAVADVRTGARVLKSFCGGRTQHLKQKWCEATQQVLVRTLGFMSKSDRTSTESNANLLQYFLEDPTSHRDACITYSGGFDSRPRRVVTTRWERPGDMVFNTPYSREPFLA